MSKIVEGNWIPENLSRISGIIFLAEKPSLRFTRNEELRKKGNFNVSNSDYKLQEFIRNYIHHSIYITDMVKTEGVAGYDFVQDWQNEPEHKRLLKQELCKLNAHMVACLSRKVEKFFHLQFPNYQTFYICHPAYVWRYKKFNVWDKQFSQLALETRRF